MKDGRLYVWSTWRVDEETGVVSGDGNRLEVDRIHAATGFFRVPIADVALFETNAPPRASPMIAPMAIVTGASLALTTACLVNPKACFGSCPTFYVSDGDRLVLQAEGFSDSIAPSLEATDVDALYRARPRDRALSVRMTNEALETHVVKRVEILAVPSPPAGASSAPTTTPSTARPRCVRPRPAQRPRVIAPRRSARSTGASARALPTARTSRRARSSRSISPRAPPPRAAS